MGVICCYYPCIAFCYGILTGQVDLMDEMVGSRDVVKGHTKHRLLGRFKSALFLCLTPDEHTGKVNGIATNRKLSKGERWINLRNIFNGPRIAHLEQEMGEQTPEKTTRHTKVRSRYGTVDNGESGLQVILSTHEVTLGIREEEHSIKGFVFQDTNEGSDTCSRYFSACFLSRQK